MHSGKKYRSPTTLSSTHHARRHHPFTVARLAMQYLAVSSRAVDGERRRALTPRSLRLSRGGCTRRLRSWRSCRRCDDTSGTECRRRLLERLLLSC
eukprot:5944755-Pleurochrysis_carterae.AAC.1